MPSAFGGEAHLDLGGRAPARRAPAEHDARRRLEDEHAADLVLLAVLVALEEAPAGAALHEQLVAALAAEAEAVLGRPPRADLRGEELGRRRRACAARRSTSGSSLGVLRFGEALERGERLVPAAADALEVGARLGEAIGLLGELVQDLAALRAPPSRCRRRAARAGAWRRRAARSAARARGRSRAPAPRPPARPAGAASGPRARAACGSEPLLGGRRLRAIAYLVTRWLRKVNREGSDRRKALRAWLAREGGLELREVRFRELQRAGRRVLGDVLRARGLRDREQRRAAREERERDLARASRRARLRSPRARGRPRCADPGSCRCRTGCSRRRRRRAPRTTARRRARSRAPAGGTAPGCRPVAPRARPPRAPRGRRRRSSRRPTRGSCPRARAPRSRPPSPRAARRPRQCSRYTSR